MPDTPKTTSQLQLDYADNTTGNITPALLRDFVVSVLNTVDASAFVNAFVAALDAAGGRSTLGLGTAATANTGTGSTNVILGSDARLVDSRAPSGAASGDLTGSYPSPSLAAVGTSGTYEKVTTDSKGRVTSGTSLVAGDIPTLTLAKISDAGTAAAKDIPATGNASATQVVYGSDTRLSDGRAPSGAASGDLTGSYPSPSLTAVGTSGTYEKVTTDSKGRVTSGTSLVAGDIPTLTLAKISDAGTAAAKDIPATGDASSTQVVYGSDTRLSNARTPSGAASGDLTGSYPSPSLATVGTSGTYTKVTTDSKGRVTSGTSLVAGDIPTLTLAKISDAGTAASKDIPATGDASSTQVVYGSDTRLTDSRTPTSHASTHSSIGSDPVALDASQITTGTMDTARLGSGTASSTTFLAGDSTWQTVSGGGGGSLSIGDAIGSGNNWSVLFLDGSANLADSGNLTYDQSGSDPVFTVVGKSRMLSSGTEPVVRVEYGSGPSGAGNAFEIMDTSVGGGLTIASITSDGQFTADYGTNDCSLTLKRAGTDRIKLSPYDSDGATRVTFDNSGGSFFRNPSGPVIFQGDSLGFRDSGGSNQYVSMDGTTQRVAIAHSAVTTPNAILDVRPSSSEIGIIVQGAVSQSANLQEWQDSSGTPVAYVAADGGARFESEVVAHGGLLVDGTAQTLIYNSIGLTCRNSASNLNLGSGCQLVWSDDADGAVGTQDVGVKRDSAGVAKITDGSTGIGSLVIDQLRTDTTASATTPGTVVGSFPVYDASGTLVGYCPLYDSIT